MGSISKSATTSLVFPTPFIRCKHLLCFTYERYTSKMYFTADQSIYMYIQDKQVNNMALFSKKFQCKVKTTSFCEDLVMRNFQVQCNTQPSQATPKGSENC